MRWMTFSIKMAFFVASFQILDIEVPALNGVNNGKTHHVAPPLNILERTFPLHKGSELKSI